MGIFDQDYYAMIKFENIGDRCNYLLNQNINLKLNPYRFPRPPISKDSNKGNEYHPESFVKMRPGTEIELSKRQEVDQNTKSNQRLQEKIRRRRHNLFKRLKEFNDRYDIDIWMTMKMPSDWIYTFSTTDEDAPSGEVLVFNAMYFLSC